MLCEKNYNKLTVESTRYVSPVLGVMGVDWTIRQIGWNPPEMRDRHSKSWLCPKCKYKWKGRRKLWREKRRPYRCPKCGQTTVKIVKIKTTAVLA